MEYTPQDKINAEKWNKEFFEETANELNEMDAVCVVAIGSVPPALRTKQNERVSFFVKSPPGCDLYMTRIALDIAIRQIEKMIYNKENNIS